MADKITLDDLSKMTLKCRFLYAICCGELGVVDDRGTVVTAKAFKRYFSGVKSLYAHSFLPAATIEIGQRTATHTKFVFRLRKGVYLVHRDAIEIFMATYDVQSGVKDVVVDYVG